MKNENWKIYALLDPDTTLIRYIGVTKRKILQRKKEHINESIKYSKWLLLTKEEQILRKRWKTSNAHKTRWINKLLLKNKEPKIITLFMNLNKLEAEKIEKYIISFTKFIYWVNNKEINTITNIHEGGNVPPILFGDDHPMKNPENIKKVSGKNHHFWGKKHTAETKRKMSLARIGKYQTEDTKTKIGNLNKGSKNGMFGVVRGSHHNTIKRKFKVWNKTEEYYFEFRFEAEEKLGISNKKISHVLTGKIKTTSGFWMCYVDELDTWTVPKKRKYKTGIDSKNIKKTPFVVTDIKTNNEYFFNYKFEAAKFFDIKACRLYRILNNEKCSYKGLKAKYI